MEKVFGDYLREKLDEMNVRPAELARRSGVTKQNIGRLLNKTPHTITGALPQPERETVEKIAKALEWNIDEAMFAAGYATPAESRARSIELPDGLKVSVFKPGLTDIEYDEYLRDIETAIEVGTRRMAERRAREKAEKESE